MMTRFCIALGLIVANVAAKPAADVADDGRVLTPRAETFHEADPAPTEGTPARATSAKGITCADKAETPSGCPFQPTAKCPADNPLVSSVLENLTKLEVARSLLREADQFAEAGEIKAAARIYQLVAEMVPGTDCAARAKSHAASIPTPTSGLTPRLPAIDSTVVGAMSQLHYLAQYYRGKWKTTQIEVHSSPLTGEESSEPPVASPYDDWSLPILILEPIHFSMPIEVEVKPRSVGDGVRSYLHNLTGVEIEMKKGSFRAMVRGSEWSW